MVAQPVNPSTSISTHAPAGGATKSNYICPTMVSYFYSRPCGRGDPQALGRLAAQHPFLLTPLREGRPAYGKNAKKHDKFLLTPLREGRP